MERGAKSQESSQAEALIDELQKTVVDFEPDTSAEQALYSRGITLASDMEEDREIRLLHSRQDSHTLLWYVLVAGAVITILHSFFFGSKDVWLTGAVGCGTDHGSRPRSFGDLPVTGSVRRQRTSRAGGLRRGAQRHSKTTT